MIARQPGTLPEAAEVALMSARNPRASSALPDDTTCMHRAGTGHGIRLPDPHMHIATSAIFRHSRGVSCAALWQRAQQRHLCVRFFRLDPALRHRR